MDKRALIEALIELLDEQSMLEIRLIVERAIASQRDRLDKLQQLSLRFGGQVPSDKPSTGPSGTKVPVANGVPLTVALTRILKEARQPLGNQDIRSRYEELYGKPISSSSVGNTLWKFKDKRFKKTGSSRWARWSFISE